jgi:replication-associated recombination protein RarA
MSLDHPPKLSELMRPKTLDDLMLPRQTIENLKHLSETSRLPHLIFYGTNGVGKTSAARILTKRDDMQVEAKEFIDYKSEKKFISDIKEFLQRQMIYQHYKICVLNEADMMSKMQQVSLSTLVEQFDDSCRFILTTNHIQNLSRALKSRFMPICFDLMPNEYDSIAQRLFERYRVALQQHRYDFSEPRLRELIQTYMPDMRAVANRIDFEFKLRPA